MGVTGLWDVLQPAAASRSFTAVAVDGFVQNASTRSFRVGIDASIWFVHATYGQEGENPELRTIFFRLTRLLKLPFLPLFVFDGPMRPDVKRGKMIDKKPHWMIEGMKRMVEAFGFEWRTAPGEAEAELAYLNRIGVIDAVLSDDVDTLVFGALMVIRNPSETLSGNRAHAQATRNHTMTFSADIIKEHHAVNLTYEDLILVALFSGGDYHSGVEGCGVSAAVALARAGFGKQLVAKVASLALSVQHVENKRTKITLHDGDKRELRAFLEIWRAEVAEELRTNSRKLLAKRNTRAAKNILAMGPSFPDIDVLMAYINPVTSEERAIAKAVKANPTTSEASLLALSRKAREDIAQKLRESITWPRDPSVRAIAKVCEDYFEWGYRERIIHRFGNWLWEGILCRTLRRKAMIFDAHNRGTLGNGEETLETSEKPLILKITSTRRHATTDHLLEYRLEIDPNFLIRAAETGIEGRRSAPTTGWSEEEDGDADADDVGKKKGKTVDPNAPRRYWMPACIVEKGEPELVEAFEEGKRTKEAKKAARGTERRVGKGKATTDTSMTSARKAARKDGSDDEGLGEVPSSPISTPNASPRKPKPVRASQGNSAALPPPGVGSGDMNDFFMASKSTIPSGLRAEKVTGPSKLPMPRAFDAPIGKGKAKASVATSTSRVASLFDGQNITIFKDLTKPRERNVFKDLTKPKPLRSNDSGFSSAATPAHEEEQTQDTEDEAMTWNIPRGSSPMRSTTNLLLINSGKDVAIPEAGPSKNATHLSNPSRTSTWKPAPFPMVDLDIPLRYDSPPPSNAMSDPMSPGPRRVRRTSSPRPSNTSSRAEQLQKSPRKSKKQVSPRLSSITRSRQSSSEEENAYQPIEPLQLPPLKQKSRQAPRRAILKDRPKVHRTRVIEISSDSDSSPQPKTKTLSSTFTARKQGALANEPKRNNPPAPAADVEVIDLCSD